MVQTLSAKVADLKAKLLAGQIGCLNVTATDEGTCRLQSADGGAFVDLFPSSVLPEPAAEPVAEPAQPTPASPPSVHALTWAMSMSPQAASVLVGDTVTFSWSGYHNVHEVSDAGAFASCDTSGGTQLAPPSSGGTHSIVMSTAGTFYYVCAVGGHCAAGQKIAITVAMA